MTKDIYYVYIYKHPDGTPYYIGKGCKNRYRKHLLDAKSNRNTNSFCVRTTIKIIKSGKEPIIEILFKNLTNDDALKIEKELIKKYGRIDNKTGILTNLSDGGETYPTNISKKSKSKQVSKFIKWTKEERIVDEAYKEKISKGLKDFYKNNQYPKHLKEAAKERVLGEKNPMYGKKHTEDVKKRLSEANSGKTMPTETKNKIKKSMKNKHSMENNPFYGKTHSEESKKKISEASLKTIQKLKDSGKDHWNKGKKHSNETLEKLREQKECPYCGKIGRGSAMNRYHFNNCKEAK